MKKIQEDIVKKLDHHQVFHAEFYSPVILHEDINNTVTIQYYFSTQYQIARSNYGDMNENSFIQDWRSGYYYQYIDNQCSKTLLQSQFFSTEYISPDSLLIGNTTIRGYQCDIWNDISNDINVYVTLLNNISVPVQITYNNVVKKEYLIEEVILSSMDYDWIILPDSCIDCNEDRSNCVSPSTLPSPLYPNYKSVTPSKSFSSSLSSSSTPSMIIQSSSPSISDSSTPSMIIPSDSSSISLQIDSITPSISKSKKPNEQENSPNSSEETGLNSMIYLFIGIGIGVFITFCLIFIILGVIFLVRAFYYKRKYSIVDSSPELIEHEMEEFDSDS